MSVFKNYKGAGVCAVMKSNPSVSCHIINVNKIAFISNNQIFLIHPCKRDFYIGDIRKTQWLVVIPSKSQGREIR